MSRRAAFALGLLWLGVLAVVDLAILVRPRQIRSVLDAFLEETFIRPPTYGAFEGGWPGDFVLRDVHVPRPESGAGNLVEIKEVRVRIDWVSLLSGRYPVALLSFKEPSVNLVWTPAGRLDIPPLLKTAPTAEAAPRLPKVSVDGLHLRLVNSPYLARPNVEIPLDELTVDLVPLAGRETAYDFRARVSDRALGQLDAWGHFGSNDFAVQLRRSGFEVTEGLRRYLEPEASGLLGLLRIGGGLELLGSLVSEPNLPGAVFTARARLDGVTVAIKGWPQELTDLRGSLRYDRGRLVSEGPITGTLEGAPLTVTGAVEFGPGRPRVDIRGSLLGLDITDGLVTRIGELPGPSSVVCEQLRRFEVRGLVDLDFSLGVGPDPVSSRETDWQLDLDAHLLGCSFVYRGGLDPALGERTGFHYPLSGLTGTVHVTRVGLRFQDVRASAGPVMLRAAAWVDYFKSDEEAYKVHVVATGVPIDERLTAALAPPSRDLLRRLNADGQVDVTVLAERRADQATDPPTEVIVNLQGVRLRPEAFPVDLEDARGAVNVRGSLVTLDLLSARHADAYVNVSGQLGIEEREGFADIDVSVHDLALDENLLAALGPVSPDAADTLRALHPAGRVGADLKVSSVPGQPVPWFKGDILLAGVTLAPESPRLRIDDLRGTLEIQHSPQRRELTIHPGTTAAVAGKRFTLAGRYILGKGYDVVLDAPDLQVDAGLIAALEGVVPAFQDPGNRPEVDGPASAHVRVSGRDREAAVDVVLEARGLRVRPPGWTRSRLDRVYGKLTTSPRAASTRDKVTIENVVAVIERPSDLPPLPPVGDPDTVAPFDPSRGIEVSLQSCTVTTTPKGLEVSLGYLVMGEVPLEAWILDLLGLAPEQIDRFRIPNLTGTMSIIVGSATVQPSKVLLNDAAVSLHGVHLGPDQLYLERGQIDDLYVAVSPTGMVDIRGEFKGRNLRLFGMSIPEVRGEVYGDDRGMGLSKVEGAFLGFQPDRFDAGSATEDQLRARAVDRGYLRKEEAAARTAEDLRTLVREWENTDLDRVSREELVERAARLGTVSRRQAAKMPPSELKALIEASQRRTPYGRILSEGTRFGIQWGAGTFDLSAHLAEVSLAAAVRALGSDPGPARGTLNAALDLHGTLADSGTFAGSGWVQADAYHVIQLPIFINILKALDLISLLSTSTRSRIDVRFDVGGKCLTLTTADVVSEGLDLRLVPPGTVTFGGTIDARLSAHHKSALEIPLIKDLFGILPSLILGGVEVTGPLENPTVTPRAVGVSAAEPGNPPENKPVLKDPKKQ